MVCWKDDLRDWPDNITVIELASLVAKRPGLVLRQRPKKEARIWHEGSFHDAADADVVQVVRELELRLAGDTLLQVRYNGRGKDATCNVCLSGKGEKLLWIWADGRYQWCWEGFRGTEPEIVRRFQIAVDSENKSSRYIAKPGAVAKLPIDEIFNVLLPIAEAAKRARGSVA